ncbi:MAG: hypothetical protein JRN42_06215 [Nitrososphaerota archaeon]|nr:hypothetical protein [Nitrososphaerota archaeon]
MSYDFKIENGDIALAGGTAATVDGADKLAQDVRLWLSEPLGTDRFNPGFGTSLADAIGGPSSKVAAMVARGEAMRVMNLYQATQAQKIAREKWSYMTSYAPPVAMPLSLEEIVKDVAVDAEPAGSVLRLAVRATTWSGAEVVVGQSINFYRAQGGR